jgi:hypothetical protein
MAEKIIHPDDVHRWMVNLWLRAGSSEREAQLTADHLVGANLAGHDSHGIGMAPRYVKSFKANELQLNQTSSTTSSTSPRSSPGASSWNLSRLSSPPASRKPSSSSRRWPPIAVSTWPTASIPACPPG